MRADAIAMKRRAPADGGRAWRGAWLSGRRTMGEAAALGGRIGLPRTTELCVCVACFHR